MVIVNLINVIITMSPNTREQLILQHLRRSGRLQVDELADLCDCSAITIRRALQSLEAKNQAVRTPGGAMAADHVSVEVSFPERLTINADQKQRIAAHAAGLVEDNQVLLMDNGSSVYLLADHLSDRRNLTIVTFFLPLVNKLPQKDNWKVILTGGQLRSGRGDLVGPLAEEFISKIYADVAFFGADGLDLDSGVWTVDPESAKLTQSICSNAARRILLADSTKLHRPAAFAAVNWDNVDIWVTDRGVDGELAQQIRDKGVDIQFV